MRGMKQEVLQNTKRSTTWSTRVWDDWVNNRTPPTKVALLFIGNCEQWNFKDAVQFGTVVLVVEKR